MSRPWMPLYCAEYIGHTTHLSAAESGAYLHLIMHYWVHGALPEDDGPLSRIAKMTPAEWRRAKPLLSAFFKDGWKHDRIERELKDAAEAYDRRAGAGKKGGIAKAGGKQKASNASSNATAENLAMQKQSQSQEESLSPFHSDRDKKNTKKGFEDFCSAHPRLTDLRPTEELFEEIVSSGEASPDDLVSGARRYAELSAKAKTEPQWVKKSSNWLRDRCWHDGASKVVASLPIVRQDSDAGRAWDAYQRARTGKPMLWHDGRATVRTEFPPALEVA